MPHRSTLLFRNFVKFIRREIGEIVRYLSGKKVKILTASQTVATARIAPKSTRARPQQCAHSAPDCIQIGSLSTEL